MYYYSYLAHRTKIQDTYHEPKKNITQSIISCAFFDDDINEH